MKTKTNKLTVVFLLINLFIAFNLAAQAQGQLKATTTVKSYNGAPESCYGANDAEITITASGGAGGYTYSIDNGNTFSSSNVFSGLKTGQNYVIVVKDKSGAKTNADWKWIGKVDNPVTLQVNYVQNIVDCSASSGYINSTAWGGTGAVTYSIDNGATFQSSGMFKNLHAGDYNIIARDANGCMSVVKTATVKGSFTASVYGDTTVEKNATAYVKIFITDYSGKSNALFTAKGYDNYGTQYTEKNLKAGENKIPAKIAKTIKYTITSIELQGTSPVCYGYSSGSVTITVNDNNVWKGINTNWFDTKNWSFGTVPNANTNIEIPDTKNTPEITGEAFVNDITLKGNAQLKISGILNLSGDINAGNDNSIDAQSGTIKYVGTTKQNIDGNYFVEKTISNLIAGNAVDIVDSLNITSSISFSGSNKVIATNGFLTLKSTATQTANVGKIDNGNKITGNVTVENYVPARKGWKFLAIPTMAGQTIHDAWQESQAANSTSLSGKGIQIQGEMSDWQAKGFDSKSSSPVVKTYDADKNVFVGIKSTFETFNDPSNAYMVFIRGDRQSNLFNSPVTETTLRTQGELKTGNQLTVTVKPDQFTAVGNPYASQLDLSKINTSSNMFYYFWDPELGNSYGAYQTVMVKDNGKVIVTPGKDNEGKSSDKFVVESGQAFFAYNKDGGTLQITEDSKVNMNENNISKRPAGVQGADDQDDELSVKLYTVATNGTRKLVDGVLQSFNAKYSNDVDARDAIKSSNSGENLSIKTKGQLLAIESAAYSDGADTTQLNFTGMGYVKYQMEINMDQRAGDKEVFLLDKFTGKTTPVVPGVNNGYEFDVSRAAGSNAAGRFVIVLRPYAPLPVTFTSVNAEKKNEEVLVKWNIENQKNVKEYSVERSTNGSNFSEIGKVGSSAANTYNFTDVQPVAGINYYRIASNDLDGKKGYSAVVKVAMNAVTASMNVFPNPVVGNDVHLQMKSQVKGIYYVSIKNQLGQVIDNRKVDFAGNQSSIDLTPSIKLTAGVYTVEVTNPVGEQSTIRFVK